MTWCYISRANLLLPSLFITAEDTCPESRLDVVMFQRFPGESVNFRDCFITGAINKQVGAEAEFDSLEVTLKYQGIKIVVPLNNEFMKSKVIDVKRQLLACHPDLQSITDSPEKMGLYVVFSNDELGQELPLELNDETAFLLSKTRRLDVSTFCLIKEL